MKALFVGTYVHVKLVFGGAPVLPCGMKSQEESAWKRLKPTLGRVKMPTTGYRGRLLTLSCSLFLRFVIEDTSLPFQQNSYFGLLGLEEPRRSFEKFALFAV